MTLYLLQDHHATQLKATPHPDIHSQHAEAIDVQCDQDPGGHNEVRIKHHFNKNKQHHDLIFKFIQHIPL